MNRFSQLEFDDTDKSSRRSKGEPLRTARYFSDLATKYYLAADFELALRNYCRALEKNATYFNAWAGQIQMLIELGEYPEAQVWADKALESFPENPELFALKAIACLKDGKTKQAIGYSDNSISKMNITPRVWLARAQILLTRKSRIAENCISKAITAAGNDSPIIKLEAARILIKKSNYSAAIDYLNQALTILTNSALGFYELGCAQAALGRPQAKQSLQQALAIRPDWTLPKDKLKTLENKGFFRKLFGR